MKATWPVVAAALLPFCNRPASPPVAEEDAISPAVTSIAAPSSTADHCSTQSGEGLRPRPFTADSRVSNGDAFDCATIDARAYRTIVVPTDAGVTTDTSLTGVVIVRMTKSLWFAGHPPKRIDLQVLRRNTGIAWRTEGDTLVLATYGEWDSRIEGGASVKLRVSLPPGMNARPQPGLSGENSAAQGNAPSEDGPGYWYASGRPGAGWTSVPLVPDDRSANSGSTPSVP